MGEKKSAEETTPEEMHVQVQNEIDQIVSDISNLGEESDVKEMAEPHLKAVPDDVIEPESDEMEEFRASAEDAVMEETLSDLKEEESIPGGSPLDVVDEAEENMGSIQDSMDEEEGCLTMTLKGRMTLKLQYECDGQEVLISFADHALYVKLKDGTEFRVPVRRQHSEAA